MGMKKVAKIGMIVVGIIVILIIALSIFIKSFLTSDRLKGMILPQAEAVTGRKVNLDEIHVSLFKGIVAKGLSVKERDGQKDFIKVGEFILSYKLLPLLKKQVVLSKIEVASPSFPSRKTKEDITSATSLKSKRKSRQPQSPHPLKKRDFLSPSSRIDSSSEMLNSHLLMKRKPCQISRLLWMLSLQDR
jgi:uncharacterized protein involved in outer membrane biogenesis